MCQSVCVVCGLLTFQQHHPVFVGHPNHLPALRCCVNHICLRGAHHPGSKGIQGSAGVNARCPTFHWTLKLLKAQENISHSHTHTDLRSTNTHTHTQTKHMKTLHLNWSLLIISVRRLYYNQSKLWVMHKHLVKWISQSTCIVNIIILKLM